MALPDYTASRVASNNDGSDKTELFLKVFGGEVLTSFETMNKMNALHVTRTISSGKTAQFPVLGSTTAEYHTPGAMIDGKKILSTEKTINIDGSLISPVFIPDVDEAMTHFEYRSEYAKKCAYALALKSDKQVAQLACLAARASASLTGGNGGSTLTLASYDTDGEALAEGIFDAAQIFDEKDIPENERVMVVRPKHYYLMARSTKVLNKDWGGAGVYSDGKVLRVAGIEIVKSNNLPSSNISADTGTNNTYHGNFTNTIGVAFHRSAVGTVKLKDLAMESTGYDPRWQGTLVVAKMLVGHGILRPEAAIEFKKA